MKLGHGARARLGVAALLVVALVAGLLVWLATRSPGETVRHAELNDGGVWVTNAQNSYAGRFNKPAGQLDLGVDTDVQHSTGLDVVQDGAAVVVIQTATSQAIPIDPASGTLLADQAITLARPTAATGNQLFLQPTLDLRGGTVAAVDPKTGQVRAQRVDTAEGITSLDGLGPSSKPLATVGADAVVAVGIDGTVYAASPATGDLVVIRAQGRDFAAPERGSLGFTGKAAQVTVVGSTWVAFDPMTARVHSPALTAPVEVSEVRNPDPGKPAYAALQLPGPDASGVLLEGPGGTAQVAFRDDPGAAPGVVVRSSNYRQVEENLLVAPPVRLGSCVFAAWAGPVKTYLGRSCDGRAEERDRAKADVTDLGPMGTGTRADGVRLRVNRGFVVVNDLDTGRVWDAETPTVKIDDWTSVVPPPKSSDKNPDKDKNLIENEIDRQPPKAQDDDLVVRAGVTSMLHVLDNDSDAAGELLAIAPGDVTAPDAPDVRVSVSGDGQTIAVTVPSLPQQGGFTFTYTVNNGRAGAAGRSSARVRVRIAAPGENAAPKRRAGVAALATARYPVVHGRAVTVGVIADWRDPENDPLTIQAVSPGVGEDPAGGLTVNAPDKPGPMNVEYAVEDGHGGRTVGSVAVDVLGDASPAVASRTQPDVVRAIVGKPVDVRPLGNDVPGADPGEPDARLTLAAPVRPVGQLTADTDLATGVVTFTPTAVGTWIQSYSAQVGSTSIPGRIRVDVLPDPAAGAPPVAVPDAATINDQTPVLADVLANDYSPRGDVVVVQRVAGSAGWLDASIVQGRWVRLRAQQGLVNAPQRTAILSYTISDGSATAVGQLTVTQRPTPPRLLPNLVDDTAVVRAGDAVTVPVLDNDAMAGGIPLKLDPAGVSVVAGAGQAFASGSVLRYVPAPGTAAAQATLEYTAYPEGLPDLKRTARVQITVTAPPNPPSFPDNPPVARSFSTSVTAGDTLTITVPTSGVDPDGDLVFVSGIEGEGGAAAELRLGRVLGFGASSIRYEAYPRSAGTELIRYAVRDRFGLSSTGVIRVGVVQPGDPQPPVAVEDDIVARPGRTVHADVLANDLVAPGDVVELTGLSEGAAAGPLQEFTRTSGDLFTVVAPPEGPAKVLNYAITDGLFDPSHSTLTVRGDREAQNPPTAVDDIAKLAAGQTSALVDVLANDRDVDGEPDQLSVVSVFGEGASIEGRQVRVQVLAYPRVVPYVIADADGLTAMAWIYVPTGDGGLPYVIAGRTITMDQDSTKDVALADYVTSPRGRAVSVTTQDTVSTSPSADLRGEVSDPKALRLRASNGYAGPAALVLQVTDATGAGDGTALTAYVSIPVQIGPKQPVLRCPDFEVTLFADGPARTVDLPRLCHAWYPDGVDPAGVEYDASWTTAIPDVDLSTTGPGASKIVLKAAPAARGGARGEVGFGIRGAAERFTLRVRIVGAGALSVRPALVEGLVAGQSRSIDLTPYLSSPLASPVCRIGAAVPRSGSGVTAAGNGCVLTVTAAATARGQATLVVEVSDAPGRTAPGIVTVTITSVPDPPVAVSAVADRASGGQARVNWNPPAYGGGLPILGYEVTGGEGAPTLCAASPCTVTRLTNGKKYSFRVRARNAVGWSGYGGPSAPVEPDTLPAAPVIGTVTPGDRTLAMVWTQPANGSSAVVQWRVQALNVGATGGSTVVLTATPAKTLAGLINDDPYSLRVQARNGLGWGPWSQPIRGQSVGTPATPAAPVLTPRSPVPSADTGQVTIGWSATDPNGPPITKYTIWRSAGGAWTALTTVSGGAQRIASDSGLPYDGTCYLYAVSATNGGGKESARSAGTKYCADGIPEVPTQFSAATPAPDTRVVYSVTLGNPRSSGFTQVQWRTDTGLSGSWPCSGGTCQRSLDQSTQRASRVQFAACNTAGNCSPYSGWSPSYQTYGPTQPITGARASAGDHDITFAWNAPAFNGRPITAIRISGDVNATLGPDATSYAIGGLGYSTTRTITVTVVAADSGASGGVTISARTNDAPPPVVQVFHGSACQPGQCLVPPAMNNCVGNDCYFVGYSLTNFPGSATCSFNSSEGNGSWSRAETRTNGSYQSSKFFGTSGGWVRVTCTGGGVSASGEMNPW